MTFSNEIRLELEACHFARISTSLCIVQWFTRLHLCLQVSATC